MVCRVFHLKQCGMAQICYHPANWGSVLITYTLSLTKKLNKLSPGGKRMGSILISHNGSWANYDSPCELSWTIELFFLSFVDSWPLESVSFLCLCICVCVCWHVSFEKMSIHVNGMLQKALSYVYMCVYVCIISHGESTIGTCWNMQLPKPTVSVKWDVLCYNDAIYHSFHVLIPLSPHSSITVSVASLI